MNFSKLSAWPCLLFFLLLNVACHSNQDPPEEEVTPKTPVTVTSIQVEPMTSYLKLNATAAYLRKETVRATSAGYIQDARVVIGDRVKSGQTLFTIQTKEARALRRTNTQDSLLQFAGNIRVRAAQTGVVTQVNAFQGTYVQDGDPLATIIQPNSLVFMVFVPFEDRQYVAQGLKCQVILPGADTLQGTIANNIPTVDSVSQVQNYILRASSSRTIPEKLNVIVLLPAVQQDSAQTLPKSGILTDETQTDFWVMQLTNDTTAIKVPIRKGIETDARVAVDSPRFSPQARFVVNGAYGLSDTAYVSVTQP